MGNVGREVFGNVIAKPAKKNAAAAQDLARLGRLLKEGVAKVHGGARGENDGRITGGEKPIRVRLLFASKLAVYIIERQWHPTQKFRTRADGQVEMRMETTGRKELIRWVLSYG